MGLPFCPMPFSHFRVSTVGDVSICSPSRVKIPVVGNLLRNDVEDVWNSPDAQAFRQSILNGTFEYCKADHCPALQKQSLPDRDRIEDPRLRKIIDEGITALGSGPTELNLHYDRSCNLKCPSCRPEIIAIKGQELDRATRVRDAVVDSTMMIDAELITLCGYGEVFSSKVHLGFLRTVTQETAPRLRIKILTNGLLLTPSMWTSLSNAHSMIDEIWVSIDAATTETYAINRGGNFERLIENLEFIGHLRKAKAIKRFYISMVVQENNFREMPDFVELGTRLGCDKVYFQKLFDSDKADMADFDERAIHKAEHPHHQEFRNILETRTMKRKIVDLYTISDVLQVQEKQEQQISVRRRLNAGDKTITLIEGNRGASVVSLPAPKTPPPPSSPTPTAPRQPEPAPVSPSATVEDDQVAALRLENQHLRTMLTDALLKLAMMGGRIT